MSNADWYAKKFREQLEPPPSGPLPPTPVRMPQVQSPGTPAPMPTYTSPQTPVPMPTYNPAQAKSTTQTNRCPSCDSGNFMKANQNAAARCYNCGYVEGRDYQQETFTPSSVNNTQATRQVPETPYTPTQIIGRVEG